MTLEEALTQPDPSARLQAALDAGTRPNSSFVPTLVARFGVEPDFNVREMLTWALVRHDADVTVPAVVAELTSPVAQARSQALHTLSKIGDPRGWPHITPALMFDPDDTVARTAWRTAVVLAPEEAEPALAETLASLLGRGDRDAKFSLSRALAELGLAAGAVLHNASESDDVETRVHALATQRLIDDPDEGFDAAVYEARRLVDGDGTTRPGA